MRFSLGSDQSCQSRVQTRALDSGPIPLVGLVDIRISASWVGGGRINQKLPVARHRRIGHMVLSQATISETTRRSCQHARKNSVRLVVGMRVS